MLLGLKHYGYFTIFIKYIKYGNIIILTSSKAIACTCSVPKSLKAIQDYEYEISECIFIGEVLEIDSILSRFTFKVLESFKGLESGTIYIGKYDPMCGPIIDETGCLCQKFDRAGFLHERQWIYQGHNSKGSRA